MQIGVGGGGYENRNHQIATTDIVEPPGAGLACRNIQSIPEQRVPQTARDAVGKSAKGYFEAEYVAGRGWVIGKQVEEQPW